MSRLGVVVLNACDNRCVLVAVLIEPVFEHVGIQKMAVQRLVLLERLNGGRERGENRL